MGSSSDPRRTNDSFLFHRSHKRKAFSLEKVSVFPYFPSAVSIGFFRSFVVTYAPSARA
jgi:hypothetical protein